MHMKCDYSEENAGNYNRNDSHITHWQRYLHVIIQSNKRIKKYEEAEYRDVCMGIFILSW